MALCYLRLRRLHSLSSSLLNQQRPFSFISAVPAPPSLSPATLNPQNPRLDFTRAQQGKHLLHLPFLLAFRSSLSSRPRSPSYNGDVDGEKLDPNAILFEGCDYNHWLITIDFPKDPKPTPEEMVETYVQTCAKVVGSVEEAKKRIYSCSTSTYHGFNVEVSEEMSEKFRGLPGVVFILPDSYIDPVNKEYGGDKYINGTIIPRPPPVQYTRNPGRFNDRNRNYNGPYRPSGSYQRGNSAYDNQGSMHGDTRNFGAQQNPSPQQNYGSPRAGERRDPIPMNTASGAQDNYQGKQRDPLPSVPSHYPQAQRDFLPGDHRNSAPPEQRDFRVDNMNYAPPQGANYGQGAGANYGQGAGANYGQGAGGAYGQGAGGAYGQGTGGTHGQTGGTYRQGASAAQGQGAGSGYGTSDLGNGENQRFSQVEQRNNMQGQQGNYAVTEETQTSQGRH